LSLKQICKREAVFSIERGINNFRGIIILSASGIPVGFRSCSFFLASVSKKDGLIESQSMDSFKIAGPWPGMLGLVKGLGGMARTSAQLMLVLMCVGRSGVG